MTLEAFDISGSGNARLVVNPTYSHYVRIDCKPCTLLIFIYCLFVIYCFFVVDKILKTELKVIVRNISNATAAIAKGWFVTFGLVFSDIQRDFLHR
jgi:hypothetical protein